MIEHLSIDEQKSVIKLLNIVSNICFGAMVLLAISPIIGLYIPTHHSLELAPLFYAKSLVVKISGFACLLLSLFILIVKTMVYGGKYLFETLIKNPWNILFLVTLVWMGISIKEVNPLLYNVSLFGWAYTYEGYIAWIAYAGIYLGASSIRSDKQKKLILNAFLITAFVIAVFTLLYEKGITPHAFFRNGMTFPYSGSFINPNHYAYYLCVVCIASLAAVFLAKDKKWKIFYILSFFLNTVILCVNDSFGSYLALLVGMVFFNAWFLKKKENRSIILIIDALFLVLSFIANPKYFISDLTGFFEGIFQFVKNLFGGNDASSAIGDVTSTTADGRAADWSTAFHSIKDHPIFGVGPDMELDTFKYKYGHNNSSHNEFLYITVCSGIPALVTFVGAITCFFVKCFRRLKNATTLEKVFMLSFGTFLVSACFGISIPVCDFVLFMMLGLMNSYFAKEKELKCL